MNYYVNGVDTTTIKIDGIKVEKGFVTNHSLLNEERFDRICCCGPKPMMVAVARYATKADVVCEVSLENLMACGLGACLCCVEKTVEGNLCVNSLYICVLWCLYYR